MERAVALCRFDEVTIEDLPAKVQGHKSLRVVLSGATQSELISIDEMDHRYIRQVLTAARGNKSRAARILGIDRRSLYRRLEEPAAVTTSRFQRTAMDGADVNAQN
jgi:DNA-binding NtrC family response regulator